MPFTLSHPALVLPLNFLPKKWVSMTGLIIGSMAPDVQSFIMSGGDKTQTHSWWGLIWFGIPISLLIAFVFHLSIREMLISHLPRMLQIKFARYKDFDWITRFKRYWPVVIISILIGGASHLFWDSFSHFNGFFIRDNAALQGNAEFGGKSVEIPFLIQYLNSGIGLLVVLIAILQVPRSRNVRIRVVIMKYWLIMAVISTILILFKLESMENYKLDDLLTSCISALSVALLITSLLFKNGLVKDRFGSPPAKEG
ncbi:MAG TPA: DUF4184 family protein [Flavitalea sp.]|nr:DUF4184 family protein [Flavitalea sp.]